MSCPSIGPIYSNPNASKSIPGVKNTLKDSSARLAICRTDLPNLGRLSRNASRSFLNRCTDSLVMVRERRLESAPTFSEIDISLSFRITTRSLFSSPAWFSPSKAMPPVIEPSPITAITLLWRSFRSRATASPSAAEMEVDEWPTSKQSCGDSARLGKPLIPPMVRSVPKLSFLPVSSLWA